MGGRSVVDGAAPLHMTVMNPLYLYDDEIARLRAAVRRIRFDRFNMMLNQFHVNGKRALLHACAHPAFAALRWDIDRAALSAGIVPHAAPNPHVTLSSNANGLRIPSMRTSIQWPVDEVSLVWSQRTQETGQRQYVVLERYTANASDWQPSQLDFSF